MQALLKNEEETLLITANKGAYSNLHEFIEALKKKYPKYKIEWVK